MPNPQCQTPEPSSLVCLSLLRGGGVVSPPPDTDNLSRSEDDATSSEVSVRQLREQWKISLRRLLLIVRPPDVHKSEQLLHKRHSIQDLQKTVIQEAQECPYREI